MDAKLIISIALGSIVSSIICYLILILMIKKRKKMSRSRKNKK